MKGRLEFGEKTASWAEEKAEYLITVTKLDKPLKRIDNAALNGVVQLENTQNQVSSLRSYMEKFHDNIKNLNN